MSRLLSSMKQLPPSKCSCAGWEVVVNGAIPCSWLKIMATIYSQAILSFVSKDGVECAHMNEMLFCIELAVFFCFHRGAISFLPYDRKMAYDHVDSQQMVVLNKIECHTSSYIYDTYSC